MRPYENLVINNLPDSEIEIEAEVPYEILAKHRVLALKKISENTSIPGFRKGHAPEKILIDKIGEMAVLDEAAYNAIENILPEIMKEKNLKFIGRPEVSITKLAPQNPLLFRAKISILPEVKLPDYKKISANENRRKTEEISVTEREIEDLIDNLRKRFTQGVVGSKPSDIEKNPEPLPEVNDEFARKLGNFKNVAELREKIKENILADKKSCAKEKNRQGIATALLAETKISAPKILIESELEKMLARFHDELNRIGIVFEEYLKQNKKTAEDLKKDWRGEAEKRGRLQIILDAICESEKIELPKAEIEMEVKHLLKHYKDADPLRAESYVTTLILNEKVFEFLENQ